MNRILLLKALAFLPLCTLILGCGESYERADAVKARGALKTALDAWKEGKSHQTLRKNTPEIVFNDPEFLASKKLVNFEISKEDLHNHLHAQFHVKLSFDVEDEIVEKNIVYIVATNPVLVITRPE